MPRFLPLAADAFPICNWLGAAFALVKPAVFTWFSRPWIIWALTLVMLGVGLTLEPAGYKLGTG